MSYPHAAGPRIVLVTGASAGFGAAIARRFLNDGAHVVALARRRERLEALADGIDGAHERLHPVAIDVTDRAGVEAALAELPDAFAGIDCLVNNAGLALGLGPAQDARADDWDRMIEVNVRAVAQLTRAVLPGMVARGRGHVVNLGSVAGTYPYPGGNVYGATKAFLHQFSLNLRSDLIGTPIRVTCVEPGMVGGTEFSQVRFDGDAAKAANVYRGMTPLDADDVAETVWWATHLPPHFNVNTVEIMPVAQSFAPFQVAREGGAA